MNESMLAFTRGLTYHALCLNINDSTGNKTIGKKKGPPLLFSHRRKEEDNGEKEKERERPSSSDLGGSDGGGRLLSHMDLKPHASDDFLISVVQANSSLEDQSKVFTSPSATYVGIYDRHGGSEASRFINNHLFPYLHRFVAEQRGLSTDVIKKAFDATEEEFLHLVKRLWPAWPQIAYVSSFCLVGAISGDMLYLANLGDSKAVLGQKASVDRRIPVLMERLSTDQYFAVEEVRKEVEALHPNDSHILVYSREVRQVKDIG
ncbi:probable protein phosphatase 2C 63 [Macadamia integrifolia]|uniref:probable protein phosphatase 2C 63 n=1 Tax=Macadamia integrifolia TaxID=60698 RepID=UPI001C4FFFB7|nr:probable protein phosphatase 2C 63 [Macadamia integrifolia]